MLLSSHVFCAKCGGTSQSSTEVFPAELYPAVLESSLEDGYEKMLETEGGVYLSKVIPMCPVCIRDKHLSDEDVDFNSKLNRPFTTESNVVSRDVTDNWVETINFLTTVIQPGTASIHGHTERRGYDMFYVFRVAMVDNHLDCFTLLIKCGTPQHLIVPKRFCKEEFQTCASL